MTRSRRAELCAGLVLLSLTAACFARLVANPTWLLVDGERPSVDHAQRDDFRPVGNDLTFFYLPRHLQVCDEAARLGRVSHWDTWGFTGRPRIGNPQAGLFYPPSRLTWSVQSPAALGWLTVGHLVWSSFGLFLLMRTLGAGVVAATVAAGCFQASPYLMAQVAEGHYPHVWAAAWYPWAFLAFIQLRRRVWIGALALAPILALTLLTGHPQEWYYLTFTLSLWAGGDVVRFYLRRSPFGRRTENGPERLVATPSPSSLASETVRRKGAEARAAWITLGGWLVLAGLSLGLAAVELVPDMAAQAWTLRGSQIPLGRVSRYQLNALNLFQLLSPTALGGPSDYFGPDNYWETVLAPGLIPLVLAAVAAARHPDRRLVGGWLLLVGGAVWFAAGPKLGLFTLLFEFVPGMDRFRVPGRTLFLASLGASVLAGLGVETLRSTRFGASGWQWLRRRFWVGTALVGTLLAGTLAFSDGARPEPPARSQPALSLRQIRRILRTPGWERGQLPEAARRIVQSGPFWLSLAGLGIATAVWSRRPTARPLGATGRVWLGMLGLIELASYGFGSVHVAPPNRFLGPDPITQALSRAQPPVDGPFRIRARDSLYSDLRAAVNGFEKVNVNDSFQLQQAADLYEPLYMLLYGPAAVDPKAPMSAAAARHKQESRQRLLDRLNVAFLVSDHVEPDPAWPLEATGAFEGSPFAIHRNPTALPRAYVVPHAMPTAGSSKSDLGLFREVDPRAAVLLPLAADPLAQDGVSTTTARQSFTPAQVDATVPDRVVVTVATKAPGLLVVANAWAPGWSAQDNGRPVPLYQGNHAQQVVPLYRGGNHEVVLRYEAPGLKGGWAVTWASAALWVAMAILAAVRRAAESF